MHRIRTLKFDYSPESYRASFGANSDFDLALLASGEGTRSDILGLYSGRYPGEGVPIEQVGAHVHVTRGGSVGIWSSLGQTTSLVGDGKINIGTWSKQLVIDRELNVLGPYTIPARNVVGVAALLRELQKLAERHPELGIDLAALEAVQDKEEELADAATSVLGGGI